MSTVDLRTKFGLVLEECLKNALVKSNISYRQGWQYDQLLMKPDFTIPDCDCPKYVIEVTQVEARNVFQRKVLRYVQAISDAKSFFGPKIITVNVLFGETKNLPSSTIGLLDKIFDISIYPTDPQNSDFCDEFLKIQNFALTLSGDDNFSKAHEVGNEVSKALSVEITLLGEMVKKRLDSALLNSEMTQLWQFENDRYNSYSSLNVLPGPERHYKEGLLRSLYLPDNLAEEILNNGKIVHESMGLNLLETVEIVSKRKSLKGVQYFPASPLDTFVADADFLEMRAMCNAVLKSEPSMCWHFEDIRTPNRLRVMADHFLDTVKKGQETLSRALKENVSNPEYLGISHTRCWMADFMPALTGDSHNLYNNLMLDTETFIGSIANPFNNLTTKSERLIAATEAMPSYCDAATEVFFDLLKNKKIDILTIEIETLVKAVLELRIYASKGLQKLNPLHVVMSGISKEIGISCVKSRETSYLFDLISSNAPVGKYDLFKLCKADSKSYALMNGLYIGGGYSSDHKADEWSGRLRSLLYRYNDGKFEKAKIEAAIFVYDGNWSEKSLTKMKRNGWTHICQIHELRATLINIFPS